MAPTPRSVRYGCLATGCPQNRINSKVYLAEFDPQPGVYLSEKLISRIRASDCLLVVLTPRSQISPIVHQEIGVALGANRPTFALFQRGLDPRALGLLEGTEYVPFDPRDLGTALERVIFSLQQAAQLKDQTGIATTAVGGLAFLGFFLWLLSKGGSEKGGTDKDGGTKAA